MAEIEDGPVVRGRQTERVRIASLVFTDSPRLNGAVEVHAKRLAESEDELPPILVHRPTRSVIDGAHRIRAMKLRGVEEIDVEYFDGSESDAFVLAVKSNVQHGLPLSLSDRRAAAARILVSHAAWSDREIARATGLSARTVQELRCATAEDQQSHRIGKDGRTRPLDSEHGRRQAAEILAENPNTSLREVAKKVGISPGTVRDVRQRLERGESPVPKARRGVETKGAGVSARPQGELADVPRILDRLVKDPALRMNQPGRELIQWLHAHRVDFADFSRMVDAVPEHARPVVLDLARTYAAAWQIFAAELKTSRPIDSC